MMLVCFSAECTVSDIEMQTPVMGGGGSTLWGVMATQDELYTSSCPLPAVPLSALALLTLSANPTNTGLCLCFRSVDGGRGQGRGKERGWGWCRPTLRVCRLWHSIQSNRGDTVWWLEGRGGNTPRTKGPLFRCDGHRRGRPGLDGEIISRPFRVTGFREDGHTL